MSSLYPKAHVRPISKYAATPPMTRCTLTGPGRKVCLSVMTTRMARPDTFSALPGGDPLARGLLRCLRYIVAGSLALLPAVAHIHMRTMLGFISLAVAARLSAGAV